MEQHQLETDEGGFPEEPSSITFNVESLRESARILAQSQQSQLGLEKLSPVKARLKEARSVLTDTYRLLTRRVKAEKEISPAAEWLIDNFYIIQEQFVQVENDFPVDYQKSIPSLNSGEYRGWPRVYEIVLSLAIHTDNMIDTDVLLQYVQGYQEEETLMLGETWAIPIMARLVLLLQLEEKASRIMEAKKVKEEVEELVHKFESDEKKYVEPGAVSHRLSEWIAKHPPVAGRQLQLTELYKRMQAANLLRDEERRWFKSRFSRQDSTLDDALRYEAQRESRLQVNIQNAVISLRKISETDWKEFVENSSLVDQMLRLDPAGIYTEMDFSTRDRYRQTVERLSRQSGRSETEIAELVLLMAEESAGKETPETEDPLFHRQTLHKHVGYYLIGDGYEKLIRRSGYALRWRERIRRALERSAVWYLAMIGLHTFVLLGILWVATGAAAYPVAVSATLLLVALFPALDLSVSAVNRFFAFFLPPRILPKMGYEEQIPKESRTLVVVPTLLTSPEDVRRQMENLEIRSLANPQHSLQYALLSDFPDAPEQHMEKDQEILDTARKAISELNGKYDSAYGDKFFFLHRKRLWNENEGVWMGWERKRGKLEELNRLLTDPSAKTSYHVMAGRFLRSVQSRPVRFVITLDADTKLPPDSALNLIRAADHPNNRAWYDPEKRRITKGYAIIQPRISIPPESARKSWFSKIFSGNVGIDPYSTAVSDIYQDLMGEAVFTGKGIYDVRAFQHVLHNRFRDNRILSHDLIESTYLRAGFASHIELFDDYPSTYTSFSKRNHRWVRGDWQIAPWLFPRVPEREGMVKNPLNLLSRWKIFDNLRRSLNPFFLTLFFILGWFWLPGAAWIWTAAAFGIIAFPIYVSLSTDLINRPARVKWRLYLDKVRANLSINSIQVVSTLIILPHQAVVQLDAVFRSLWRLLANSRGLLEWTSASKTESTSPNSLQSYLQSMAFSILLGLSLVAAALFTGTSAMGLILPFAFLWISAPVYLWRISQPLRAEREVFSSEDEKTLRIYARRTWFYFERFMTEEHSWLPPDNYQEDPQLAAVARTSPTNIGLGLVSIQSAYNMGYITLGEFLDRVSHTLRSVEQLERYKGHLYNWYDTRIGKILHPMYVSTVDSGNLAAGLIVLKESIEQQFDRRGVNSAIWRGLQDTLWTVQEIFEQYREKEMLDDHPYKRIFIGTSSMLEKIGEPDYRELPNSLVLLKELREQAVRLSAVDLLPLRNELGDEHLGDLQFCLERPLALVEQYIQEMQLLSELNITDLSSVTISGLIEAASRNGEKGEGIRMLNRWKRRANELVSICEQLIDEMDFSFLYDKKRGLFRIGFDVSTSQADKSTYDLLASEARIASYIAIAKGDVPPEHWFRLSRRLTSLNKNEILLSWGGTMFEYLMPLLFMRTYPNTLLSHTYESVIRWQKEYGIQRSHPWGASESAYYFLNMEMHYQYRAFGVPGLGMKRGLAEEYVVAPYASMLALMVESTASLSNLKRMEEMGAVGLFGFYDAIDFTPSRLKEDETGKVVKSYMAHHHGMSLIALDNVLNGWQAHHYFHSDPRVTGCDLLLQERIPRGVPIKEPHPIDAELEPGDQEVIRTVVGHAGIAELDASPPQIHILSNGSYSTFITHSGTGCSTCGETALTGWRPDTVQDTDGLLFYVRDLTTGEFWSATHQPVRRKPDRYDTWFHNDKVVTSRVDNWIETTTETCVSPDHPFELRKLTLTNYSNRERELELTSYAEVVLNQLEHHYAHPAFSRLFLQTDYLSEQHAVVVKRRPRSEKESASWLVHTMTDVERDEGGDPLQFETDKGMFIGRGRSLSNPAAMDRGTRLSGSIGNVTDPIVSLRRKVKLGPGQKRVLTFGLGWAESLEEAVHLADTYQNPHASERAFELAAVYSRVELAHIDIDTKQALTYQKLASYLLYPNRRFRAPEETLVQNRKKQQDLWPYGLSGDLPIVVLRITDTEQIRAVKRLLKAHAFWKLKGIKADLVILNDHPPSYADELQESIMRVIELASNLHESDRTSGVFLLRTDKMPREDLTLIESVAHLYFDKKIPPLSGTEQILRSASWHHLDEPGEYRPVPVQPGEPQESEPAGLHFFNGYGGFSSAGDEYRITINQDQETGRHLFPPSPWVNVVANPEFGFIATESGAGYTWSMNSRENKLTCWSNEPVTDPHSEAFYIRDEEQKIFWSPMPGPVPGNGSYEVVHGFGYSRYEHVSSGLEQQVTQFVPIGESVKISLLTIRNVRPDRCRLSLFRYQDWVLGTERALATRHLVASSHESGERLYVQNHYNNEFAGRVAFAALLPQETGQEGEARFTTDRSGFIGRNRSLKEPLTLVADAELDNRVSVGGDACAAFQTRFELAPGEESTFVILTGESAARSDADRVIDRYSDSGIVAEELRNVRESWKQMLGGIRVELPDKSLELLMNGWLNYQTVSSRMWARSAYYQAGGAFGFRDQLQDAMACLYVDPAMTRKQILLHAAYQFREGDVLHWWHPPTGRGIRSRITDDRLWLPYVTGFYLCSTGDRSILHEQVTYLNARNLEPGEHEVYLVPQRLDESDTLFEHCCRAIDISLAFGSHGLPLIGAGDWNDGMNRVGIEGKGESVWLGFFLYEILERFVAICDEMGDRKRSDRYRLEAEQLRKNLNENGWDGDWYLRAFYDDGTPLGSNENDECKIDAISQAWSVITGVATPERRDLVLKALEKHMISEQDGIIRLLTPPFDKSDQNPGYIKGYIPGVRENGGQYTHAALWTVKAFAKAGRGDQAVRYLHMINPVNHAISQRDADLYKVEPYVVAADVYGESPLTGQGGWTWYTGSAGWMYRVALESILGITMIDGDLLVRPVISSSWKSYSVTLRLDDTETVYEIVVKNPQALQQGLLEGSMGSRKLEGGEDQSIRIPLDRDGGEHRVELVLKSPE